MGQLDSEVALVTGSSRSIGKAIAIGLAKEGARLVLAARTLDGLNATADKVREAGSEALVIPTDVRDEGQIEALFRQTIAHYGRLDILINNAGIFGMSPIDELTTEIWDDIIATNLRAPFLCARAAFRIMKKQGGGRIINIGSISASRVRPANAPYSSAKFGLVGLTQTIALEGREYNINCGILHPGLVKRDEGPPDGPQLPDTDIPVMEPEEIAAAAVFMACQPPHVNVLEIVQLPKDQPYLGRG
jgi:NAD(P)-dependent dehydrogenase (short-subunit alcohol dehydrogenase family)